MSRPINIVVLTLLALGLSWVGVQKAVSQAGAGKQLLVVHYPNPQILISGTGTPYRGLIYVSVFQAGRNAPSEPVATSELGPSARSVWQLPLGVYEVRYGMRTGSELKTFIVRDVILRAEAGATLSVEMNADAKTTVIGGDMSAQEMRDSILQLRQDVAALKRKAGL